MAVTTRPVARGLNLPMTLRAGRRSWPVRYNALLGDGRLLIMGIVDDFPATARGLGLRVVNKSKDELFPDYRLSARDLARLQKVLALSPAIELGGRRVAARWRLAITQGGTLRLQLSAPGLVEQLDNGDGARLAIEGDALVETVDVAERTFREDRAAARARQRAALTKARAAFLRVTGAKRATLVDDPDEGWPYLRAAARLDMTRLVSLQAKLPGVLVAHAWAYHSDRETDGVRLYAPMSARELALGCMWAPERFEDKSFGDLVDALVEEAGARVIHVRSRTLYLWPTKRRGKLARSQKLLRQVCKDAELEARASDYVRSIRAGEMLVFWWD
jgi:hypothetical protein